MKRNSKKIQPKCRVGELLCQKSAKFLDGTPGANIQNCSTLAGILKDYCIASGQSANLEKSSIIFSANTPQTLRQDISGILGIEESLDQGKYLGIPSVWGKTKHQALAYVREKISKKVLGWSGRHLSFAGREVMIKAVINAIPIFPMTCFKFPARTCRDLNSLVSNFWWDGQRKTHWVAWQKLTRSKNEGGMGFRDFIHFNKALLAKTVWRLIQNPNDLWAQTLKGLYFPNCSFLEAVKGHRASWCWSSILEGRDHIKEDLCWQIGNGRSVRIWQDNWVPSLASHKLNPANRELKKSTLTVDSLIFTECGMWDLSPITRHIDECSQNAILSIPLPRSPQEDKVKWSLSHNGVYTVKLGYHCVSPTTKVTSMVAGPSYSLTRETWKATWKVKVTPRVTNFLWRLLSDAVVTNEALLKRKRSSTDRCPICHKECETIEHMLFQCSWVRCTWFGCSLSFKGELCKIRNFKRWWLNIIQPQSQLTDHDVSLTCWLLWYVWKERNEVVFQGVQPNPIAVIDRAQGSHNSFWDANWPSMNEALDRQVHKHPVKWIPPPVHQLKVNVDAAFHNSARPAAMGIVCRDHHGNLVWAFADKIKSISAFMTEALALKRALMLAQDLGNKNVIFETDCHLLVRCLEKDQPDLGEWQSCAIIDDILSIFSSESSFSTHFSPRQGNKAAHMLAASTDKGVCPIGWVEIPLPPLFSILDDEATEARRRSNAHPESLHSCDPACP